MTQEQFLDKVEGIVNDLSDCIITKAEAKNNILDVFLYVTYAAKREQDLKYNAGYIAGAKWQKEESGKEQEKLIGYIEDLSKGYNH